MRDGESVKTIVLDFDGTIKPHGKPVSPAVMEELRRVRDSGLTLLLVTGRCIRELEELVDVSGFDMVVAENGAVFLRDGRKTLRSTPGWREERGRLARLGPPGCEEVIVAFDRELEERVVAAVDPSLEDVEFNKDRLMILPKGTSKESGLLDAFRLVGATAGTSMCIGDGENDLAMFRAVRLRVALNNSVDSLKSAADYVTNSDDGEGVIEAIRRFVHAPS